MLNDGDLFIFIDFVFNTPPSHHSQTHTHKSRSIVSNWFLERQIDWGEDSWRRWKSELRCIKFKCYYNIQDLDRFGIWTNFRLSLWTPPQNFGSLNFIDSNKWNKSNRGEKKHIIEIFTFFRAAQRWSQIEIFWTGSKSLEDLSWKTLFEKKFFPFFSAKLRKFETQADSICFRVQYDDDVDAEMKTWSRTRKTDKNKCQIFKHKWNGMALEKGKRNVGRIKWFEVNRPV